MSKSLTFASVLLPREFENLFFEIDVGKLKEAMLFLIFDVKFLTLYSFMLKDLYAKSNKFSHASNELEFKQLFITNANLSDVEKRAAFGILLRI
jgi:hypothetical protein